MNKDSASLILESIIESLRVEPNQFQITLKVIGQLNSVTNGGIGQIITATGGSAGSTTIGNKVSVDGSTVEIGRQRGAEAISEQTRTLIAALEVIARELKASSPNKSVITKILESLKDTWVPPVISSVVTSLISLI